MFFWVQLCDLKNFEKLREHHVVDRPHPQHSRRGDRCHGEHVVSHEEGRRPNASPHTPLAQRTPLRYTVSLRKDTKRDISIQIIQLFKIKQKKSRNAQKHERQTSIWRYEQTVLIYCHKGLKYSYAFHLLFAHDEGRAWPNAVGTVGDGARERLACLHQGSGHLRLQEVLLDTMWVWRGNNENNNTFKNKHSTHQHT